MNIFDKIIENTYITNNTGFTGLTNELFSVLVNNTSMKNNRPILLVAASLYEASKLYENLLVINNNVHFFPMDDFLTSEAIAVSPDLLIKRLETLNSSIKNKNQIIVTNLMGYLRFLPAKQQYANSIIKLKVGTCFAQDKLIKDLYEIGYVKESIVTKTGEMGIRGFIIDIYPIESESPIRIEFFGDEIESIRYFDETTQKSIKEIKEIVIFPNHEFIAKGFNEEERKSQKYLPNYVAVESIYNYLDNPLVIYKDYDQIKNTYVNMQEEVFEYRGVKDTHFKEKYFFDLEEINVKDVSHYLTIENALVDKDIKIIDYSLKKIGFFNENSELLNKFLKESIENQKTVIICLKQYQIKSLIKHLSLNYTITDIENIKFKEINLVDYQLEEGFVYKDYIFLASNNIYRNTLTTKKYKTSFKYSSKIKDINKLSVGDHIVHNIHGIGTYNGIKTLIKNDVKKDYLEILYLGKDKLYIPVEKIDLITKFSGKEGILPKINRLSGIEWTKTKQRVKNKIKDIAEQLLKINASRESKKGYAFSENSEYHEQFANKFDYTETKDQIIAINQINEDMEKETPMDRILCGDVGFGKTEVAFRAAFKSIYDSKQVLYLCPTTILSNQHYENAMKRFDGFPVNIRLLNRFTSVKETKKIIEEIKQGTVDFVIGTHRLLSEDIRPKDLGLLIIDEEQRFGVMHKEKIKKYKSNIDILTLTATPIPRTLQLSLVGLRSLSLIETPPVDRYPIQTYVIEENSIVIKQAIYKELSRSGQIFILYNHVDQIEKKVNEIQRLVPEARIVFAHGQMSKTELEDRMLSFVNHEYDVLICTTIIETGIDIPNANTLIILEADRFGVSQLYQIRGRVGRSNKIAYSYLMFKPGKILTEIATKRLNTIKDFTELGSGFSIATRDLSIRGAGDILGSEQAGFIDTVGVDLYLRMLNQEVSKMKGIDYDEVEEDNSQPLLNVETHINDSYIDDNDLKIEIHRMINSISTVDDIAKIKIELEDRFGRITKNMEIYMYEELFEKNAKKNEIIKVNETRNYIELVFSKEKTESIVIDDLFVKSFKISPYFRFQMKNKCLKVILDTIKLEKHYVYYLTELLLLFD